MSRSGTGASPAPSREHPRPHGPSCPLCGFSGHAVPPGTLRALSRAERRAELLARPRWFCGAPECPALYYGADGSWAGTDAVAVRVGVKASSDPAPLCYCFGYTEADVRRELTRSGTTDIPRQIAEGIRSGRCDCEAMNPSGRCCLGEVRAFVKKLSCPA